MSECERAQCSETHRIERAQAHGIGHMLDGHIRFAEKGNMHIESVPSSDEIDNFAFNVSIASEPIKASRRNSRPSARWYSSRNRTRSGSCVGWDELPGLDDI